MKAKKLLGVQVVGLLAAIALVACGGGARVPPHTGSFFERDGTFVELDRATMSFADSSISPLPTFQIIGEPRPVLVVYTADQPYSDLHMFRIERRPEEEIALNITPKGKVAYVQPQHDLAAGSYIILHGMGSIFQNTPVWGFVVEPLPGEVAKATVPLATEMPRATDTPIPPTATPTVTPTPTPTLGKLAVTVYRAEGGLQTVGAKVKVLEVGIRGEGIRESRENPAAFLLPPGTYHLSAAYETKANPSESKGRNVLQAELRNITVEADKTTEVSMSFKIGQLIVMWTLTWKETHFTTVFVYPDYQHDQPFVEAGESPACLYLPQGVYDLSIEYYRKGWESFWLEDIEVKEGETTEIDITPK